MCQHFPSDLDYVTSSTPAYANLQSSVNRTSQRPRSAACAQMNYLMGKLRSPPLRSSSRVAAPYHRKLSLQLNPPQVISNPMMYSNESSLITSMIGQTTDVLQVTQLMIA